MKELNQTMGIFCILCLNGTRDLAAGVQLLLNLDFYGFAYKCHYTGVKYVKRAVTERILHDIQQKYLPRSSLKTFQSHALSSFKLLLNTCY